MNNRPGLSAKSTADLGAFQVPEDGPECKALGDGRQERGR